MATITQPLLQNSLLAASAIYPQSQTLPKINLAISQAVDTWIHIPTSVTLQGQTSGTVGTGNVLGILQFLAAGQFQASFSAAGLVGQLAPSISQILESGISSALTSATYIGQSVGVGAGTDLSKILIVNQSTLVPILMGTFAAQSIAGQTTLQLATAIANGLAALLLTGTGTGGVTPVVAGNIPGVGTSISFFL